MAGSDDWKKAIPAWQQQQQQQSVPDLREKPQQSGSKAELVEQAAKFLQDESIAGESTERKAEFLKSKGLSSDQIEGLLDSSATKLKTAATSVDTSKPSSSPSPPSTSSPASSKESSSTTTPRDVPPIITYPEFLLEPARPPPLVSIGGVLYSIYGAVALGTGIYAASEYLIKPMMANLTGARHELARTTSEKLKGFNEKLEQNVSVVPAYASSASALARANVDGQDGNEDGDVESITSDPIELWHRDVATQTSDSDIAAQQGPNDNGEQQRKEPDPLATVSSQQQRIQDITARLRKYQDADTESVTEENSTRNRIVELHTYLSGLSYNNGAFSAARGYGIVDASRSSPDVPKSEEDAIVSFRSEIRAFKGALLSARNFPAGNYPRKLGSPPAAGR